MRGEREQTQTQERDIVAEGYEQLLSELQAGKSERFLAYLEFMSRFPNYSSNNQLLIYIQRPDASLVAGYTRWMKEGNPVKKGEKGIGIMAPVRKKVDVEGEEGYQVVGFKTAHVFDISQTVDPSKVPSFWEKLPDDAHEEYKLVKDAVLACGIAVFEDAPLRTGVQGMSMGGTVKIAAGLDTRSATMVLVHEWAHELIHRREMTEAERLATPRQTKECQAEAVSYIVSGYMGVRNPFSSDYLQSWGNDAESLQRNVDVVQRTSKLMISTIQSFLEEQKRTPPTS